MNCQYARARSFYEWLAICWLLLVKRRVENLAGDLGRSKCTQAKMNIVTRKLGPKKLLLHSVNLQVYQCSRVYIQAAINPSHMRHVFSISRARSMHAHVTRVNNHIRCSVVGLLGTQCTVWKRLISIQSGLDCIWNGLKR